MFLCIVLVEQFNILDIRDIVIFSSLWFISSIHWYMSSSSTILLLPIIRPTILIFSCGVKPQASLNIIFLSLFLGGVSKSDMLTSYTILLKLCVLIVKVTNPHFL